MLGPGSMNGERKRGGSKVTGGSSLAGAAGEGLNSGTSPLLSDSLDWLGIEGEGWKSPGIRFLSRSPPTVKALVRTRRWPFVKEVPYNCSSSTFGLGGSPLEVKASCKEFCARRFCVLVSDRGRSNCNGDRSRGPGTGIVSEYKRDAEGRGRSNDPSIVELGP